MKLDDIIVAWEEDSQIEKTQLVDESVKSAKLHSKYYTIYVKEKLKLTKMEFDLNKLMLLKYDYFKGDLDKDTLREMGWPQFQKRILKTEIEKYIDADQEVITIRLNVSYQKEKVLFLKDIISAINQRTFHIKNILEARKFENGVY